MNVTAQAGSLARSDVASHAWTVEPGTFQYSAARSTATRDTEVRCRRRLFGATFEAASTRDTNPLKRTPCQTRTWQMI